MACSFCPVLDGSEINKFGWADGEPNELLREENKIQLRMHADYSWNDAQGSGLFENYRGGTVNKYICQCESSFTQPVVEYDSYRHVVV